MVFNSMPFALFFVVVFFVYWFPLKNTMKGQNIFLLVASWFFYGYADWRMLLLLLVATAVFFYLGKGVGSTKTEKQSYWLTFLGVALGVGTLLYFKYFNFFIESFARLFEACGVHSNLHTFNILIPLGISFFTFRLLSYVIDIRRGKMEPTSDFVAFATYIAFFPCILSGPIDRPQFVKQLQTARVFNYDMAVDGCRQFLWGLFKKMVVADNCAIYVNQVWDSIGAQSGSTLIFCAILYLFQIYADFSGYSDMAIGVGKLLGLKIADNFKFPLFSLNIADYWRRWHITLTQWLTDYVFMPLNIQFRNLGNFGMILAIVITFVLIGMWHGANWTFAVFGLYHGLLYVPLILSGAFFKKAKMKTNRLGLPVLKDFGRMVLTFVLVVIGLIVFRAESLGQAWQYFCGLFDKTLFSIPWLSTRHFYIPVVLSIIVMLVVEWLQRNRAHAFELNSIKSRALRWSIYFTTVVVLFWLGGHAEAFIYFQF